MAARPSDPAAHARSLLAADLSPLHEVVELTADEEAAVRDGLRRLPTPLFEACHEIVDNWANLTTAERVAALLALANAVASINEEQQRHD